MKVADALYLALGVLGLAAALLVPGVIYRFGTSALPFWGGAVSPGPLSSAHAFLGTQCESCHTANQGIKAGSCITCHAPDAFGLGKQSTAFHATIQECRGCHVEHNGVDTRPIKMDHAVLTKVGLGEAHAALMNKQSAAADTKTLQHYLAGIPMDRTVTDGEALACTSCHGFRDKHQGLFGNQCADCHKTETWKIAGFLHPSPKSQACNQCHQAPPSHYMMHFSMMDQTISGQRGAKVEQCHLCHQTDAFNDIKGRGWFKMH